MQYIIPNDSGQWIFSKWAKKNKYVVFSPTFTAIQIEFISFGTCDVEWFRMAKSPSLKFHLSLWIIYRTLTKLDARKYIHTAFSVRANDNIGQSEF